MNSIVSTFMPARRCALFCAFALSTAFSASALDLPGLPPAGPPRHSSLAPIKEKTLDNGLRVIAVLRTGLPIFTGEMLIKSGAEADPPKLAGLAHITADILNQGTATRTAPEIASAVEALGARLETEAHWDAVSIKLTGLSDYAPSALPILADVIRNPSFKTEEVERVRRQTLDQLRLALEAPGTVARLAAGRVALGLSPYAHPDSGTLASLTRITRKDIVALHHSAYRPGNAILVVSGPMPADDVFALAAKVFGDWTGSRSGHATAAPAASSAKPAKPRVLLIDMPNAGQAAVFLACPSIPRNSTDYFAGKVANALLGGGYSSWLNQEVRVKRGLSYGAGSGIETHRTAGLFLASAQTKNESAAEVAQVMETQVTRLATETASPDYLRSRKAVLIGAFSRDLETNDGYVKRLGEIALYGLPLETMQHTVEDIDAVDAEGLRSFAGHHLPLSAMSVVIAGEAEKAEPPLKKLFPQLEVIPQDALDFDASSLQKAARR
jgi:zinc protease